MQKAFFVILFCLFGQKVKVNFKIYDITFWLTNKYNSTGTV